MDHEKIALLPRRYLLVLLIGIVLTCIAYWPGLHGIFIFDDASNILENRRLMDAPFSLEGAARAAFSSDAGMLNRPVSMLSLWLNALISGADPFGFKLTNLVIHLINAGLLFLLSRRLMTLYRERHDPDLPQRLGLLVAVAATVLWAVHPLNLTSVLYVVQRMNSLAALFTLAGLLSYVSARMAQCHGEPAFLRMTLSVGAWGLLAVLSKENGALLPLYMLAIEAGLLRFAAADAAVSRTLKRLWTAAIALMLLAVAGYIVHAWHGILGTYQWRGFSLGERLMTESRMLWLYLQWGLIPDPNQLGIFHDDLATSRGWLSPPSTLIATLAWVAVIAAAWLLRRRAALFTFAVLWYLLGHAMESSFIPLELVFEHRNYLPLAGPALALSFLVLASWRQHASTVRNWAFVAMILGFTAITAIRAHDWGSLDLAIVEARHHPQSARAALTLGDLLSQISRDHPELRDTYVKAAREQLIRSSELGNSAVPGLFSLMMLDSGNGGVPDEPHYQALLKHLTEDNIDFPLLSLYTSLGAALESGAITLEESRVKPLFEAALANRSVQPYAKAALLLKLSEYYAYVRHDYPAAVNVATAAAEAYPTEPAFHLNLVNLATQLGNLPLAERELDVARRLNSDYRYDFEIETLQRQLNERKKSSDAAPGAAQH